MIGVEIDILASDSLKALELYEKIFEVQRIEVTNLEKGSNEAVFLFTEHDFTFWMKIRNTA